MSDLQHLLIPPIPSLYEMMTREGQSDREGRRLDVVREAASSRTWFLLIDQYASPNRI